MIQIDGIYSVLRVVDGDGFIARHFISNEIFEFRLYGLDAPEIKFCNKLKQDEKELHIAGSLLLELGHISASYLRALLPSGTQVSIKQEPQNLEDKYKRKLCYAFLKDGKCINEKIIEEGYAKAYPKCFCEELPKYQLLNTLAKQNSKGLFSLVSSF